MTAALGIVLALLPFLLVLAAARPLATLPRVVTALVILHLTAGLVLQGTGTFTYPIVIAIHGAVGIGVIYTIWLRRRLALATVSTLGQRKALTEIAVVIAVLLISAVSLWAVHYDYTGKISTATDRQYTQVQDMEYPYPYFADAWYTVAFAEKTIESGTLPLSNPLSKQGEFVFNPKIAFHSMLAELFMLLTIPPLTGLSILMVVSTTLLVLVSYALLRELARQLDITGVLAPGLAAIGALSVLYITASGNLPTVWTVTPLLYALIVFTAGLLALMRTDRITPVVAGAVILLLYPPAAVFYAAAVVTYAIYTRGRIPWKTVTICAGGVGVAGGAIVGLIALRTGALLGPLAAIGNHLWFTSYIAPASPSFPIWAIVPFWALVLAIPGVIAATRRVPWLAAPTILALGWWLLYAGTAQRLGISYPRVVFIAALLTVIVAGVGLLYLARIFLAEAPERARAPLLIVTGVALALFVVGGVFYTERDSWTALRKIRKDQGIAYMPAAPANRYYTEADRRLFADIHNKRFLALPWKGTVIGVTTTNYPLSIKGGTIRRSTTAYRRFMSGSCETKRQIAAQVDYVYTPPIDCAGFKKIGEGEGGNLILYKTNGGS